MREEFFEYMDSLSRNAEERRDAEERRIAEERKREEERKINEEVENRLFTFMEQILDADLSLLTVDLYSTALDENGIAMQRDFRPGEMTFEYMINAKHKKYLIKCGFGNVLRFVVSYRTKWANWARKRDYEPILLIDGKGVKSERGIIGSIMLKGFRVYNLATFPSFIEEVVALEKRYIREHEREEDMELEAAVEAEAAMEVKAAYIDTEADMEQEAAVEAEGDMEQETAAKPEDRNRHIFYFNPNDEDLLHSPNRNINWHAASYLSALSADQPADLSQYPKLSEILPQKIKESKRLFGKYIHAIRQVEPMMQKGRKMTKSWHHLFRVMYDDGLILRTITKKVFSDAIFEVCKNMDSAQWQSSKSIYDQVLKETKPDKAGYRQWDERDVTNDKSICMDIASKFNEVYREVNRQLVIR